MSTVSGLSDHTGYLLRMVSNAVSHDFARRIAAEGVTVAEWVVLRLLYDADALAPSALADRMGMTRGAISRLAERLIAKGLIVRAADPADGRAHRLSLSAEGRAKTPRLAALADRNEAEHFGPLDPADQAALVRILKTLIAARALSTAPVD